MGKKMTSQEIDLIQPTVGWEGELLPVRFVLIEGNHIRFVKGNDVLVVFEPTSKGVRCDQDNLTDPKFVSELTKIAKKRNLSMEDHRIATSHIFEFVTLPSKNSEEISAQFEEIKRIEIDLIQYIVNFNNKNPAQEFICVQDWIDDYNLRFPQNKLTGSLDTKKMFIAVDYSIKQLESNLQHNVQFNFVAGYNKKMGSKLIEIIESNNRRGEFMENIINSRIEIAELKIQLGRREIAEHQARSLIRRNEEYILANESILTTSEKEKTILLDAEINAERACHVIRKSQHDYKKHGIKNPIKQKFAKLEGFFFILSMRIVTEITFLQLSGNTSKKNKYYFYLKSQISDLIDGLSEKDKTLLRFIKDHWSDDQKNELLRSIAGSSEALTVTFSLGQDVFSVKDVLESALGWRKDKICDLLPGFPVKKFDSPYEPKTGVRSKEHTFPMRRVLLEYRGSAHKTISQSEKEIKKILQLPFCKTTYLDKDNPLEEKMSSVVFHKESPAERVDRNVDEALKFIHQIGDEVDLKKSLKYRLDHADRDTAFKQINYLYLKIQDEKNISEDLKLDLEVILFEMYSNKVFESFSFPLHDQDDQYIDYLQNRYAMTKKIPHVIEFLSFIQFMDPKKFEFVLQEVAHALHVKYILKSGFHVDEVDEHDFSLLDHACDLGLKNIIDLLLAHGAKAIACDILFVARTDIFSPHLVDQLIRAGADLGEAIVQASQEGGRHLMDKIINVVGFNKCEEAIVDYCLKNPDAPYVKKYLKSKENIFSKVKTVEPVVALSKTPHSVMFPSEQKKEKLYDVSTFSEEMKKALGSYQGKDKLNRKTAILTLIADKIPATHLMAQKDIYDLLVVINTQLNRSSGLTGKSSILREMLNPSLLSMLRKIDIVSEKTLEKDFSSHLGKTVKKAFR